MPHETPPFLLIGLLTVIGFYAGKAVRLTRLPSLLGYMIIGLVLGPSVVDLLGEASMDDLGFLNEIALGLVAFTIGSELSLKELRKQGGGIVSVILCESFGAFLVVLLAVAGLRWWQTGAPDWPLALIFAAMAPASAPAGTVAIIQEFRAKGPLTTALYAVVGFDDGLAILIFGFASALAISLLEAQLPGAAQTSLAATMSVPLKEIVFSLLAGVVLGYGLCFLLRQLRQRTEYFVLTMGFVFLAIGLSEMLHMSLILTNLTIGFVMVNTRNEAFVHRVGEQVTAVMPLVFILFFGLAGAHLRLDKLPALGLLGLVYILGRTGGLIGGSRLGALFGRVNDVIRRYVGLGILSQAGVAIGLSLIVLEEFRGVARRLSEAGLAAEAEHVEWIGATVITTITATCVFFEIVGPVCAKIALTRAGEIEEE